MSYAEGTTVTVEKSKLELERLLIKHRSGQRVFASDDVNGCATCMFSIAGRQVRLRVPLPTRADLMPENPKEEPRGWRSWSPSQKDAWLQKRIDQLTRERWRALVLLVKAKLELVELGLSTIEREFLADIYLPNGRTVHEEFAGAIEASYLTGKMPKLFGTGGSDG